MVVPPIPPIDVHVEVPPMPPVMAYMHGYEGHASCFADGNAYAIVGDPGTQTRFCGNTQGEMEAEVERLVPSPMGISCSFVMKASSMSSTIPQS